MANQQTAVADAIRRTGEALVELAETMDGVAPASARTEKPSKGETDVPAPPGDVYTKKYLESLPVKQLRALAVQENCDELKIKGDIIKELTGKPVGGGEPEDEEEEYTRDELEDMNLKDLRDLAKENGHSAKDIKGLSQSDLVDLLLGPEDEDEEADEDTEDEAEEEEEEEEEEDEGEEEIEADYNTLNAMSDAQLKKLHEDNEIDLPKGLKKMTTKKAHRALVDNLMKNIGEEADEDED